VKPLRRRCGHIGTARSAVTSAAANARYETRAPLRIFQSKHAMAMNADRQRWLLDAIVDRQR